MRSVGPVLDRYSPDLIIVEQAIKNVEAYPLLARQAVGRGPRVAMWGQGRTFSTSQGAAGRGLKDWLTRRSDWFFAYTQEGAEYVAAHGYAGERITVLLNSTDTAALRSDLRAVTDEQLAQFRYRHNLLPGATALFLGGVDESKGINFLIEAARRVAQQIPGFRLLIGGEGASGGWVRERQAAGDPVIALGRIDGHERALALSSADLMMVPQWVGLVAVDALAAGVPIVTTRHESHSPEFGYLIDGENALVTSHDVESYAASATALLRDPGRRAALSERGRTDSAPYSVEAMATRFAEGVRDWSRCGSKS
jgi:glycosyltransferase involved in cell wall biosynthesis